MALDTTTIAGIFAGLAAQAPVTLTIGTTSVAGTRCQPSKRDAQMMVAGQIQQYDLGVMVVSAGLPTITPGQTTATIGSTAYLVTGLETDPIGATAIIRLRESGKLS